MVNVGDAVTYFDELNQKRQALVTCVHSQDYINVVVVTNDPSMTDSYGQQIARVSSVGRKNETNKAGRNFVEMPAPNCPLK
jgi:hypothetical protein